MKSMIIPIVGFVLLASFTSPASRSEIKYQSHEEWLEERYREAISIKAGMTRADLLTVFMEDGGLQRIPATRYILRNCNMIKIDVDFDTEYGQAHEPVPDENLKIKSISMPYLDYKHYD